MVGFPATPGPLLTMCMPVCISAAHSRANLGYALEVFKALLDRWAGPPCRLAGGCSRAVEQQQLEWVAMSRFPATAARQASGGGHFGKPFCIYFHTNRNRGAVHRV